MRNIKSDVEINKYKLDSESELYPSLYFYYSAQATEARIEKEALERKFDQLKTRVEMDIRQDPNPPVKLTETSIALLVKSDSKVQMLQEEVDEVRATYFRAEHELKSIETKKGMLDNLTRQYIAGYYADPSDAAKSEDDRAIKKARNRMNGKD